MSNLTRARKAELNRAGAQRGALTEYLAIRLAGVTYAVAVSMVREIVRPPPITAVPRAPGYVLGIVSIRGRVVTIIDARVKLGIEVSEPTPRARVLIVEVQSERIGLWVDEVLMVYRLSESEIERTQQSTFSDAPNYVDGVARPVGLEQSAQAADGALDVGMARSLAQGEVFVLLDLRALLSEETR